MKSSWNLYQAGLALVMVPLVFQVVFFVVLLDLLNQAEQERKQEIHAKKVLMLLTNASRRLNSLTGTALLTNISGDTSVVLSQEMFTSQTKRTLEEMRKIPADSKEERRLLDRAALYLEQVFRFIERNRTATLAVFIVEMPKARGMALQFDNAVNDLVDYEYKSQSQAKARHKATEVLYIGLAVNIILAIILALFFAKFVARRLTRISENSERLTAGMELYPPLAGTDEIARLDRSFHRMAAALSEAARRRQEAERFKQQLFNMVSHDIRSPLTSLMASLNFISAGRVEGMPDEALDIIRGAEESSSRLLGLTSNLLDLERMAGDARLILELEDVSISEILSNSYTDVQGLAESRGVSIEVHQSDVLVRCDRDRLTQVVINLLSNAIKFSPQGATIAVSVEDTGNEVKVRVTDRGKGIAASDMERVFQPFEQGADQTDEVGAGLGLAICKSIVEAHGGTIGAESEEGAGSSFWFSIPKSSAD